MKPKPHPVNRRGRRNLECFRYGTCLDYVVKQGWQHWDCSKCTYRSVREPDDAVRTVHDTDVCYELPPAFARNVWQRFG
ncbi:MAG: hypothetical protein JRI36_08030 [Deltaproteobacteria bacterium]|nr:hypothetical protein [Deltaproteobacteria bacterium]